MSNVVDDGLAALDRQLGIEPGTDDTAAPETTEPEPEATEEVVTPATEQETTEQETVEPLAEPLDPKFESYLTRFGADPAAFADLTPEMQKALQAGFEADGMTGRQGQELGELKKLLDQIQEQTAPQPAPQPQYDLEALRDRLLDNPAAIEPTLREAWAQGNREITYLAVSTMADIDPVRAEAFRAEIAKQDAIAAVSEQMAPHIARGEKADFDTTFTAAWNQVKAAHPDIDQFANEIIAQAEANPDLLRGLQEGTPESNQRVLSDLYKIVAYDAQQQDGSTLTKAVAEATATQQAETEAAKREGFVATGSQRVESERKTESEEWLDRLNFDRHLSRYMAADD